VTVPSIVAIEKWRHVVRVFVRLAGVVLVGASAVILLWSIPSVLFFLPQGRGIMYVSPPLVTILVLVLRPLVWAAIGIVLFRLDNRLAKLIVPMPSQGCPNCGYWVGSREIKVCPECGTDLTGGAS
jgi:hypothetical protein